jgi:hypothetical protein
MPIHTARNHDPAIRMPFATGADEHHRRMAGRVEQVIPA